MALSVGVGLGVLAEIMEAEVDADRGGHSRVELGIKRWIEA